MRVTTGPEKRDAYAAEVSDPSAVLPPGGTQAIRRAIHVLRVLGDRGELSTSALAHETGLTVATASRMVKALVAEGMVRRNPVTEGYHLGARTALLGQAAHEVLGLEMALPVMRELRERTGESVNLAVRDDAESVVLLRVQSTLPLRFEQRVGARFPLYSTASGKAILAFATDADTYLRALPARLPRIAPGTIATSARLRRDLEQTRSRGYAIDQEENVEGVRCIGAPVLDDRGTPIAALVLQAPGVRMREPRIEQLGPVVAQVAGELAHVIPERSSLRY